MLSFEYLVGTKFKKDGNNKKDGFDCYNLAIEVFKQYGIELPKYLYKFDQRDNKKVGCEIIKHKNENSWIKVNKLYIPTILLIKNDTKYINHVGIYIGENKFIHAMAGTGVIISNMNDKIWQKRIKEYYIYN